MTLYKLPGWGEIEAVYAGVDDHGKHIYRLGEAPHIVIIAPPGQPLTPVAPPTPPEPPPGAYDINGVTCFNDGDPDSDARWRVTGVKDIWLRWSQVCVHLGPDVTIQRLVPEPPKVELPWSLNTISIEGTRAEGAPTILRWGEKYTYLSTEATAEMAAALLAAAGGAP